MPVQTIRPNGAGSFNLIPYPSYAYARKYHWEIVSNQVDEEASYPVHEERGSYYVDTYALPNPTRLGTITNVRINIRCRGRPWYAYCKTAIYNNSSLIYGSEHGSSAWTNFYTDYSNNPWTGNPWTWDELDALQAGVALRATGGTYSECSEVWVEITSSSTVLTLYHKRRRII